MGEIGVNKLLRKLVSRLAGKYGREAQSLALLLLENITQLNQNELLLTNTVPLPATDEEKLEAQLADLLADIPIQHILGWAEFYGYRFKVSAKVLVPRQETEELVHQILELCKIHQYTTLLDIGTGSGCIAIAAALENEQLTVTGIDKSSEALEIARQNARTFNKIIKLYEADIFKDGLHGRFDIIVSNPPYVLESEKADLPANVRSRDPDMALFVPDDDPLQFYQRISELALKHLNPRGLLIFEINERFGQEMVDLLARQGFRDIVLKRDLNERFRFVWGFKN
jgi:release factor glutamine methyltransferase